MTGIHDIDVSHAGRLKATELITAVGWGVAFWFAAALLIRYGEPAGLLMGLSRVVTFAATIPLTWWAINLVERTPPPRPSDLMLTVAVVTGSALLCDVVALTWFPGLYATEPRGVLSGVILILWGVGWALALAIWRSTWASAQRERAGQTGGS